MRMCRILQVVLSESVVVITNNIYTVRRGCTVPYQRGEDTLAVRHTRCSGGLNLI